MKRISTATALLVLALVCHAGRGYPHSPGGRVPALSATRGIAQNGFDHRFANLPPVPKNTSKQEKEEEQDSNRQPREKENQESVAQAFPRWWSQKQLLGYLQATGRFPEDLRVDYWHTNPSFIDTDW